MTAPKKREQIPQSVRFSVFRRDNFTCVYCGRSSPEVVLHADHAKSVAEGGLDIEANLVTACSDCNFGKGRRSETVRQTVKDGNGLVGLFGLQLHSDGKAKCVFRVDAAVGEDYLCSFFSAMDGDVYEKRIEDIGLLHKSPLFVSREDAEIRSLAINWEITDYQARMCCYGDRVPSDFNNKWKFGSHDYYVEYLAQVSEEDLSLWRAVEEGLKEARL